MIIASGARGSRSTDHQTSISLTEPRRLPLRSAQDKIQSDLIRAGIAPAIWLARPLEASIHARCRVFWRLQFLPPSRRGKRLTALSAGLQCLCAALLGIALLLPVFAPLASASGGSAQAECCCRSVCHCGNMCKRHSHAPSPPESRPSLESKNKRCPCSRGLPSSPFSSHFAIVAANLKHARAAAHPAGIPQTQARLRLTSIRVRQNRGPPSPLA